MEQASSLLSWTRRNGTTNDKPTDWTDEQNIVIRWEIVDYRQAYLQVSIPCRLNIFEILSFAHNFLFLFY